MARTCCPSMPRGSRRSREKRLDPAALCSHGRDRTMARMSSHPPEEDAPLRPAAARRSVTALEPLGEPVFRLLWSTWLTANLCMWMTDVAAAWTMTTLTSTPIWVALVQSASTLPVFLLGLPSGALADIVDRRRLLFATQFWLALTAGALCVVTASGWMNAPLLLMLVFINGI